MRRGISLAPDRRSQAIAGNPRSPRGLYLRHSFLFLYAGRQRLLHLGHAPPEQLCVLSEAVLPESLVLLSHAHLLSYGNSRQTPP